MTWVGTTTSRLACWCRTGSLALVAGALFAGTPSATTNDHWAFKPPIRPAIPHCENSSVSIRNPIDAFLAAEHERLRLTPAPLADRRTLLRRVTLDLTGLPPTFEEVEAFLADDSADAYERQVERLLASPHYGERWGRFWLDLARWAESDGFEANELRPSAWRYRDYVVRAFNEDKPYDRFLREQIAGDELEPYADEHLVATGFLAAGRNNNNEEDKVEQLNGPLVDIANTVASVTLGLTLRCAQCHDHKFEPLTIEDYYGLHGCFVRGQINGLALRDETLVAEWQRTRPPELDTAKRLVQQIHDATRARLRERAKAKATEGTAPPNISDEEVKNALTDDDRRLFDELKKKISRQETEFNSRRPHTWGFYSPATSPHAVDVLPPRGQYPFPYKPDVLKTNIPVVLKRGSVYQRGAAVTPTVPSVLDRTTPRFVSRSAFVDWLVSDANPLTARVWVNFVWQQHFGRGLVVTSGDFGLKGARPSHPALLDWLACELREPTAAASKLRPFDRATRAWSTKHLHRLIVLSAAYRRAALFGEVNAKADPDNVYLWRWQPRRLESEAVRDAMLAVAGRLDTTLGGPSHAPGKESSRRRSLYLTQKRNHLPPMQALFDAPVSNESCPLRHVSTVPLQPLHLLNHAENVRLAEALATRVRTCAGNNCAWQIEAACQLALHRKPDDTERVLAERFFATTDGASNEHALTQFCQALLNLNEFLYLE